MRGRSSDRKKDWNQFVIHTLNWRHLVFRCSRFFYIDRYHKFSTLTFLHLFECLIANYQPNDQPKKKKHIQRIVALNLSMNGRCQCRYFFFVVLFFFFWKIVHSNWETHWRLAVKQTENDRKKTNNIRKLHDDHTLNGHLLGCFFFLVVPESKSLWRWKINVWRARAFAVFKLVSIWYRPDPHP